MWALDDVDAKKAFCKNFAQFYDSDGLSDFTITCGQKKWNVHKFVLCVYSEVFAKACNGCFKETKDGNLDLSDHDPEHVEALVHYLYHFCYQVHRQRSDFALLMFHIDMAILADKYFIVGLATHANESFCENTYITDIGGPCGVTGPEVAMLALKAYTVSDTNKRMCVMLVEAIVCNDLMEVQEVQQAMRTDANFATDVVLTLCK